MLEIGSKNALFHELRSKYLDMLSKYLVNHNGQSEVYLNEGYKLGREFLSMHFDVLSIIAIHHDCLIEYLENLETATHLETAEKAILFLEEVISPLNMVNKVFHDAINLLNKRSVEFAVRIRALQKEIVWREKMESDLRASEDKYRLIAEKLQSSLNEKDALLKEVYHRVKNNLQVMSSLLNLQILETKNESAVKALTESSARVKSMGLVHEMLYQTENLSSISISEYIHDLCKQLYNIYSIDSTRIELKLDIEDIYFNIDTAIPFGLILNELISNSFKHAFPNNAHGHIIITLKNIKNGDKEVKELIFQDDGIGIPVERDIESITTLGMQLISNLSKQINGEITFLRTPLTTFKLRF